MSETPKRRWGDRRDAVLLRETDALHFIMGIIYPHRADNEAYIAERIDLEPIKAYLAKKNVEGIEFKYTFFHVIVAALVKTITLRPKLNRFYRQQELCTSATRSRRASSSRRNFPTAARRRSPCLTPSADRHHRHHSRGRSAASVYATRHEQKLNTRRTTACNSLNAVQSLPRLSRPRRRSASSAGSTATAGVRTFVIGDDPELLPPWCSPTSAPSSLARGLPPPDELGHLLVLLRHRRDQKWTPLLRSERHSSRCSETVDLGLTVDERIADGYYYSKSIRLFKHLLAHPSCWSMPL